ncbi:MAG: D-alanine--D-alanine ligase family protein [Propionibacteriaceae bacterium]
MGSTGHEGTDAAARPRVAVIFGGASSEHEVSCLTAGGVVKAIDPQAYDVLGVGITKSGRWVVVPPEAMAELTVIDKKLPELTENAADALLVRGPGGSELVRRDDTALHPLGSIEVAFSLLHGPFGEDGTVQGLFEMLGTRYVGAGVLASAVGMDKHFMKIVLAGCGLPVGPYAVITPAQWERDQAAALDAVAALSYPLYVKPCRGGSSMGITRVEAESELVAAVEQAQRFDPKVIVEQGFANARELECGVIQGSRGEAPTASSVAEIRVHTPSGFYDYDAKYLPEEQVDLDVPADIPPDLAVAVQNYAIKTFEAIGCEGLARVDTFYTSDGRLYVNEINTMPGFTEHSMFPRMWAFSGVSYPELVDRLITLALERPVGLR